jgi:hypothetical protein
MRFLEPTITTPHRAHTRASTQRIRSRVHATPAYALALICASTLLVSACEAQKPAASAADSNLPKRAETSATTAVQNDKQINVSSSITWPKPKPEQPPPAGQPRFSEPAITGKIIDAQTKQPIEGAFVYGFYATHGGGTLAGGSKPGEPVKSFLAVTDANGVYKLDAWDTGTRQIGGTRGTKFPVIGIYKPGYDLWSDQMSTIAQYRPKSGVAGTEVEIKDGVRDWTKFPHLLVPLTKELDRYNALDNSNQIMMMIGECGWETYAPLLLAQHHEKKDILKRNLPPEQLDKAGYGKSGYFPEQRWLNSITVRSGVDRLISRFESGEKDKWRCADPTKLFGDRK